MRIITLSEIRSIIDEKSIIQAVRTSLVDHYKGVIKSPDPLQMTFGQDQNKLSGDCHVKSAYSLLHPYFCIKVATGFYKNSERGLPVNNGLLMLFCAQTGEPVVMFRDQGYLTSIRTAAAGALAAGLAAGHGSKRLGIVGTGHQAELQARWINAYMDIEHIQFLGAQRKNAYT